MFPFSLKSGPQNGRLASKLHSFNILGMKRNCCFYPAVPALAMLGVEPQLHRCARGVPGGCSPNSLSCAFPDTTGVRMTRPKLLVQRHHEYKPTVSALCSGESLGEGLGLNFPN